MLRQLIVKLSEPRFIARAAAVFLLSITTLDLALPQFCEEDFGPLLTGRTDVIDAGSAADPGTPEQPAGPEDCFCCCSHLEPAAQGAELASLMPVSVLDANLPSDVPPSPSPSLYRPPRLA
ncbi:MAG: hypothetical protein NDJ92_17165 [Thermoanaerobaculia bacterium]|nr:hypothetical protein [Thermoanaerobaculia bacterium]